MLLLLCVRLTPHLNTSYPTQQVLPAPQSFQLIFQHSPRRYQALRGRHHPRPSSRVSACVAYEFNHTATDMAEVSAPNSL